MASYRVARCRAEVCRAWVIWAETEQGNRMPVDAKPAPAGSLQLQPRPARSPVAVVVPEGARAGRGDLRMAHHATCPDADAWRSR